MSIIRKYLASLLLLVFITPFIYQPVHTFLHHRSPDALHVSCNSLHHQQSGTDLLKSDTDKSGCPVLEFSFATFHFTDANCAIIIGTINPFDLTYTYHDKYFGFKGTSSSLRAPPICS